MGDNWRHVLHSQQSDLDMLQEKNAALDNDNLEADMDKILNRPSHVGYTSTIKASVTRDSHATPPATRTSVAPPPAVYDSDEDDPSFGDIYGKDFTPSPSKRAAPASSSKLVQNPLSTPSVVVNASKAPETADRFIKAKVTMLTKQLEDGLELRKKMEEQTRDLQRQLKTEREENKSLNKRINLLETELRKSSGDRKPRGGVQEANSADAAVDALTQDVNNLRKELETAERIAKQADSSVKTKDSQLKRAAETISKFKAQLQEAQLQMQGGAMGDKARLDASENRVKVLERQRAELLEGFRKQMKLIDILKRQKVHIEAARLLSFTEEEFMKTLDWKI